jgi:hypothetical protein
MGERYIMSDMGGGIEKASSETTLTSRKTKLSPGCYVSIQTGFVLTLLVVAIAVGTAVVVHFATDSSRSVVCDCGGPGAGGADAVVGGGGHTTLSPAAIRDKCKEMAANGDSEICKYTRR